MKRLSFSLLGLVILLGCNLMGQNTIVGAVPDSSVVVSCRISKFELVEEIRVKSKDFEVVWIEKQISDSLRCNLIEELVSECAILELPAVLNVEVIHDSILMLFGKSHVGAIQDRQLILMELHSGTVLGWYAFFVGRGFEEFEFGLDFRRRVMVIGSNENHMVHNKFYIVDRQRMVFHELELDNDAYLGFKISLGKIHTPTVVKDGYFEVQF
jgi:hypothetical protein